MPDRGGRVVQKARSAGPEELAVPGQRGSKREESTVEEEAVMKALDGLKWKPKWTTHLGCLKGCLEYLGVEMSDAWLFGGTGHAFVMNVHEQVCPSGPAERGLAAIERIAAAL